MVTAVVILVAAAAIQGVYNLLKEARHDFDLIDPLDKLAESKETSETANEPFQPRKAA
jgi:hypothetical protein